jgi:hypothetical protein
MRVTKHEGPDGVQDGYILDIVRDGRSISQIGVLFDSEVSQIEHLRAAADGAAAIMLAARYRRIAACPCGRSPGAGPSRHCAVVSAPSRCLRPQVTEKHEWVGRGADGFPTLEGKVSEIKGKHLTIRCASDCLLSRSWGRRQVDPETSTSVHQHLRLSGRRLRLSCSC